MSKFYRKIVKMKVEDKTYRFYRVRKGEQIVKIYTRITYMAAQN
jgi:hypothetical protein